MNAIFTIARLTFQEAVRRRIVAAALVMGLLFLTVYGLALNFILAEIVAEEGANAQELGMVTHFLMQAGLYVVNFLLVMMTVLTSVDTLSGEILSGTVHTIAAKPLRRAQIVLGKWLGFLWLIGLYFIMMAGGVLLIVRVIGDYQPQALLNGVLLMWLNVMLLLSISLLGGTRLSTLANGTMLFGLYGLAFIGGWVEQIGSLFNNSSAVQIGTVSSLILPSEALWRRAIYEMRSPIESLISGLTPFSLGTQIPSTLFIGYAALYTLIALLLTIRLFSDRDL